MFCTHCGTELDHTCRFCHQCGKATAKQVPPSPAAHQGLSIPLEGRKIGGVCAGFARYIGVDVTFLRIFWLTLAIFTGVGFVAYLIAWLLMPKERYLLPAPSTETAGQTV